MDNQQSNNITILINNYVNVNTDSSTNSDNSNDNNNNNNSDNNDINNNSDTNDNSDNIDLNNNNLSDSECNDDEICVICLEKTDKTDSIKACNCANSYHIKCLLTWIIYKDSFECEICKTMYNIPNEFIIKYYDEIENIKNQADNKRRYRRRNAMVEQYHDDEIIPVQRHLREIMCYIGLSGILVLLFSLGIILFININT